MPPLSAYAAATGDVNFSVGDKFSSFAEVEEKIDRYCSANYVKLWKRDARTIQAAKKRVGKIAAGISDVLKYQTVKFCCIQGGKKFTTQATERCSSTFKKDCPFFIYVAASKAGAHLEVRSLSLGHNHDTSEDLFKHLPQQRKLPPDLEEKAKLMLELEANKKLVRKQLEKESHKVVTLKDLHNIVTKAKSHTSRNDLEATVSMLRDEYGASVRLLVDKKDELRAIYFQDEAMKASFDEYPEFLSEYRKAQIPCVVIFVLSMRLKHSSHPELEIVLNVQKGCR
ncbi:hypothetical protein HPB48_003056 [Haemaphysalis longicornis]|uniref:ZSWIM3 N-terminal domain-containing protein n=1 Tax=Haemaphysalis longicornis TaxID=44386 RepID=A0A9J6FBN7_HAELO|nr:hypothetical protein HPB48_003056 [Haemaphysalis longicornis]